VACKTLDLGPYGVIAFATVIYLILGCFLDRSDYAVTADPAADVEGGRPRLIWMVCWW
jgi:hypothetical protein